MTLAYTPGATLAHRLDPRTKLAFQAAFALAAFAHTTPLGLVLLTGLTVAVGVTAALSPRETAREFRVVLPFLLLGPVVEGATLGAPWFVPADAVGPALASYRVVLVLVVSAAYVRTTPVRESRAAVEWVVPGKPGRALGLGVGLTFRYVAVFRNDLRRAREAMRARLGDRLPVRERIRLVAVAGLGRAFDRSDRLAVAMRARCLSWNPTLPRLRFGRRDGPVFALSGVLLAWAVVPLA
ncbi:energy-coupling factor transporter transmembrane component T family protein [Halomarina salina]|uniref:Energy-coupling factor transporter transmembrane component T family protein n=1 Tax=Halomarina salina TaxID=1872699 RepID=A0ABD5RMA3_9EURY